MCVVKPGGKARYQHSIVWSEPVEAADILKAAEDIVKSFSARGRAVDRFVLSPDAAAVLGSPASLVIESICLAIPCSVHSEVDGPVDSRYPFFITGWGEKG